RQRRAPRDLLARRGRRLRRSTLFPYTTLFRSGMALANRKEVAKLAGVSEATVSRVFNNVEPLRESTKQKVFQAAKQLNYQPNVLAKKFATGKSGQIGVV